MSEEKFQNKYRISSARLPNWDYGSHGLYFVTICTKDRINYFGEIAETQNTPSLKPTKIGEVAFDNWIQLPKYYSFIELDEFILMPNHFHGILFINKPEYDNWQPNKFGPQKENLGAVMRGYKSSVKKYANSNKIEFEWQGRYYDRIIRDDAELINVRQYIFNNPAKWQNDMNNPGNLYM